MSNDKKAFSQILEDLQVPYEDMMDNPKAFTDRVIAKSKELAAQLDAKSTLIESERTFKADALKNKKALAKAEKIFDDFAAIVAVQDPEVLVHLISMFPDITQMCQTSIRSMAMRSGNVATLSKRKINAMYIKLRETYEAYSTFMQFMYPEKIYTHMPVIPPKKGNYSDYSATAGIKEYEFILDGVTWLNPFAVANKLDLKWKNYMDVVDQIEEALGDNDEVEINGFKVKLVDISKNQTEETDEEEK